MVVLQQPRFTFNERSHMSAPLFLTFMSDGTVWKSQNANTIPVSGAATVVGTLRVNSDAHEQKLTTLSGSGNSSSSALSMSPAANGRYGVELT